MDAARYFTDVTLLSQSAATMRLDSDGIIGLRLYLPGESVYVRRKIRESPVESRLQAVPECR
jgi:hypothetical protein